MQPQMSLITLGVADIKRSRRFYAEGFGWKPVFETPEIVFYQLNGFVFGTWLLTALEKDMQFTGLATPGAFALAHNVATREDVQPTIERLVLYGGRLLRTADAPPHGGFRGYLADPDDHPWEIAWNPAWPISPEGYVRFGRHERRQTGQTKVQGRHSWRGTPRLASQRLMPMSRSARSSMARSS